MLSRISSLLSPILLQLLSFFTEMLMVRFELWWWIKADILIFSTRSNGRRKSRDYEYSILCQYCLRWNQLVRWCRYYSSNSNRYWIWIWRSIQSNQGRIWIRYYRSQRHSRQSSSTHSSHQQDLFRSHVSIRNRWSSLHQSSRSLPRTESYSILFPLRASSTIVASRSRTSYSISRD